MNLTGSIDAACPLVHSMVWIQETEGRGQTHASPSQNASKLNALLGTGKLQRDTCTSGSFGWSDCVRSRWTWLPLTSRLATAFGWDKFYQKSEGAARELSPFDDAENEASAAIGHRYVGPAGGYEVELRNGVILRLRFRQKEMGEMTTEYRISARWMLPMKSLLDSVDRVVDYFKMERYLEIPFTEDARHQLLGCQLEQSLQVEDCGRVGDSIGEAQHVQAAGLMASSQRCLLSCAGLQLHRIKWRIPSKSKIKTSTSRRSSHESTCSCQFCVKRLSEMMTKPRQLGNLRLARLARYLVGTEKLVLRFCEDNTQMTRFRDVKVCNNLVTDEIDDHRIQSDYECTIGLQNPEGKNSTLGITSAW